MMYDRQQHNLYVSNFYAKPSVYGRRDSYYENEQLDYSRNQVKSNKHSKTVRFYTF